MTRFDRVFLVVCDSMGIGAMPDAAKYDDVGRDTLGNLCRLRKLAVPNLERLGLGNIRPLPGIAPQPRAAGAFGKAAIASDGKDTTTGHWEMMGILTAVGFPTYPKGFPADLIERFEKAVGRKSLGNCTASGTEIIRDLGDEHVRTGSPIVYTSADSVFQIAMHEEVIPLEEQRRISRIARELMDGEHRVGRVIMRPFLGKSGSYARTKNRMDLAIDPPSATLLDNLAAAKLDAIGVGKIGSIFNHIGPTREVPAPGNSEGIAKTTELIGENFRGLCFVNLVDFDMLFGHRQDPEGYSRAIEEFDVALGGWIPTLRPTDLMIVTADHGCDPTGTSTDHSREYVPIVAFGPGVRSGVDLGTRSSLADMGATIAEIFGVPIPSGTSFLGEIAG
jgi:phosphopentomutase